MATYKFSAGGEFAFKALLAKSKRFRDAMTPDDQLAAVRLCQAGGTTVDARRISSLLAGFTRFRSTGLAATAARDDLQVQLGWEQIGNAVPESAPTEPAAPSVCSAVDVPGSSVTRQPEPGSPWVEADPGRGCAADSADRRSRTAEYAEPPKSTESLGSGEGARSLPCGDDSPHALFVAGLAGIREHVCSARAVSDSAKLATETMLTALLTLSAIDAAVAGDVARILGNVAAAAVVGDRFNDVWVCPRCEQGRHVSPNTGMMCCDTPGCRCAECGD